MDSKQPITGPELTEYQENFLKKGKSLEELTLEELAEWIEICRLCVSHWKNHRGISRSWQYAIERAEEEIEKRGSV